MKNIRRPPLHTRGFTLLEVLITLVLLAFGLTALVNLQMKLHMTEMESYQRGQAIVLIQDMIDKLKLAGATSSAAYITATPVGTGDAWDTDENGCQDETTDATPNRDLCDWSNAIKGAATESSAGERIGTLLDGRGCIEVVQAQNVSTCTPAIYRVTVTWQGLHETKAPDLACGQGEYDTVPGSNDGEPFRRAISSFVSFGLPTCQL